MQQIRRKYRIAVCDDEKNILEVIRGALSSDLYDVTVMTDARKMLDKLLMMNPDVVVSDIRMPGISGIDVLREVKKKLPLTNVVLITAYASVETAIEAIRGGAFDYIVKPFKLDDLRAIIQRAVSEKRIDSTKGLDIKNQFKRIIGTSTSMQNVGTLVEKVAKSDCTVLITGESGTGKELIAQTIHTRSSRNKHSFVSINCGALSESLLESELFGYEKGAFTGAQTRKIGLFEYAGGGTVFLDEVGDMSPALQLKLLRVLQEHEIKRVGGVETIKVEARVLSATNKNLKEKIQDGTFRDDLYYRLNVVPVEIPPLRERIGDLEELLEYFIGLVGKRLGINRTIEFDEEARALLDEYAWPGNVREVEHFIERLLVVCDHDIIDRATIVKQFGKDMFASDLRRRPVQGSKISLDDEKAAFEKDLIVNTLKKTNGNKYQAAKLLNLTRQNLRYKLKKYGIK